MIEGGEPDAGAGDKIATGRPRLVIVTGSPSLPICLMMRRHVALNSAAPRILAIGCPPRRQPYTGKCTQREPGRSSAGRSRSSAVVVRRFRCGAAHLSPMRSALRDLRGLRPRLLHGVMPDAQSRRRTSARPRSGWTSRARRVGGPIGTAVLIMAGRESADAQMQGGGAPRAPGPCCGSSRATAR